MTHHDSDEAHNARRPEAAAFDYDNNARLANGGVDEAVYVRRLRLLLRRYTELEDSAGALYERRSLQCLATCWRPPEN